MVASDLLCEHRGRDLVGVKRASGPGVRLEVDEELDDLAGVTTNDHGCGAPSHTLKLAGPPYPVMVATRPTD